jgi:HSP20 family protein
MNTRLSVRDINNIQRRFDNLLEELFEPLAPLELRSVGEYSPPCDIEETESHYVVSLDVPGMAKEDLNVEVSGDSLIISGSRKEEHLSKKGQPQMSERYQGSFFRCMSLPGLTEDSKIEAIYKDGVLRVAIPRAYATKKKTVPISAEKTSFWNRLLGRPEEKQKETKEQKAA